MDITIKVTDLLWKVREMNRAEMDYVTLSVIEEDRMPDGEVLPRSLNFSAFTKDKPYMGIDYEDIPEADIEYDEGPMMFTNIK